MTHIRPLPAYLVQRFQGWRATTYQNNRAWYRRLAAIFPDLQFDVRHIVVTGWPWDTVAAVEWHSPMSPRSAMTTMT